MIELKHLKKSYTDVTPLKDVNAVINEGDVISVIGPSGCGKSTLIRCINLLEQPTDGQILLDGVDITEKGVDINEVRKKMGMVFQSFNLFGHLTVVENVMCGPMDLLGVSKQEAYDKAIELLHLVGMERQALKYPSMLSGGQRQRVAIARTLSMDPDIILFDEPTSALDPTMVGEVQSVIYQLAHMGKTMMIVTHEMRFAREICNRVFYMDEGGIYEEGTPQQIFDAPQKKKTRRFIRHLKVFEAVIDSKEHDFIETVASIDRYGYQNRIPPKTIYRIQSAFEELVEQILLPRMEEPKISFTVEFEEADEKTTLTILYGGEAFTPEQTENKISWEIARSMIESVEYSEYDEEGYTNRLVIVLKKPQ